MGQIGDSSGCRLKVRDAKIGLSGAPGSSTKDDLGVVPLLYAYARYQATDRLALELEGGADNDDVYTFAFFHYAVAGVRVRF